MFQRNNLRASHHNGVDQYSNNFDGRHLVNDDQNNNEDYIDQNARQAMSSHDQYDEINCGPNDGRQDEYDFIDQELSNQLAAE